MDLTTLTAADRLAELDRLTGRVRKADDPLADVLPVVWRGATRVDWKDGQGRYLPRGVYVLCERAEAAGWEVVTTHALGSHVVTRMRKGLDGVRAAMNVAESVETLAVRAARVTPGGTQRAIGVWAGGSFDCGVIWSEWENFRPVNLTTLRGWLSTAYTRADEVVCARDADELDMQAVRS